MSEAANKSADVDAIDLGDLPPSAKLVAKVLEYETELTQKSIADESNLPLRTVRYALERLDDVDAIRSRTSLDDARQQKYRLTSSYLDVIDDD